METIKNILATAIVWKRHPHNDRYFYSYFDDRLVLLRVNDFPDEPAMTLISQLEIFDVDDPPNNWEVPFHA